MERLELTGGEDLFPSELRDITDAMIANGNNGDAESIIMDYQRRGEVVLSEIASLPDSERLVLIAPRRHPSQGQFFN